MGDGDTCSYSRAARADVWIHRDDGRRSSAVMSHHGARLVLEVHSVGVLAGLAADASWLAGAQALSRRGQTVEVRHDGMHLLTLGAADADDRDGTGTVIRMGSWPDAPSMIGPLPAA